MTGIDLEQRTDEALMELYAGGEVGAFDQLFRRYEGRAQAFLRRRIACQPRAEELYQELFLRIHRARFDFDPRRSFAPWFFEIARRLVIDELRRAARKHEVVFQEDVANLAVSDMWESDAERALDSHQQTREVFGRISELERYVLTAAKVEGRSYAELAQELGKSVVAIKKLASRAVQRLRDVRAPAGSVAVMVSR